MTIDVYDAIAPPAAEWEALALRTGAPPFARPGWFAAWWPAFGVGDPLVVTATRRGRLTGVLPLRRRAGVLASPTNAHTPAYGALTEDAAAAGELAGWVFAQRPRRVQLDHVDAADATLPALQRAAARSGHRMLRTVVQRSPYAVLVPGEDVDRRLGAKAAGNLRRIRRRLEEAGHVEMRVETTPARLDRLLEEGFRLESSGWKAERGTAIRSSPSTLRFYVGLARWASGAGLLRLGFLRLDGHAIAFAFGLQDRTAFYLLKGGYDPAHRRFAPGKLLFRSLMAGAVASGAQRFELLGAAEPWKLEWTLHCHERTLVRTYAPTVLGTADRATQTAYLRYGRPFAKRALTRAR
ncbi:MAG TPA: GNAT family N-acetyltransferase [Solirubrobacteraceae bacterium]|nr:GNAT family N-acetyltransferase [Solirubrobacteraceae bacterium]